MSVKMISAWSPACSLISVCACATGLPVLTLVDVLHDALAVSDLRRGQLVHLVAQVCHGRLAHLLLVRNRRDGELAGLLLDEREGRYSGLLRVRLAVDFVSVSDVSDIPGVAEINTHPMVHGGVPSSWKRETSSTQ